MFVIEVDEDKKSWIYVIEDLNIVEIIEIFYEQELQKTSQSEFRTEKVSKKGMFNEKIMLI